MGAVTGTMRQRGRVVAFTLLVTLAALAALACLQAAPSLASDSASPAPVAASSPGAASYRVGVVEYVDSLNPFVGYSVVANVVYHLNYDYLTGYDPVKLQARPEFAESWSHSEDGLVWTFKIRPGMTWQDGEPATARDVAFTFNLIIENQLSSYTFYVSSIEKVEATDDATVVFTCSAPKADILAMPVPILPEHIWSKVPVKKVASTFENPPACIGSGPYQVVEYKRDSYTRLVPNPAYWRGAPHLSELLFVTYTNADTMVQDLKAGNLDGVVGVPPAQMAGLSSETIATNPCTAWGFTQLSFNCYESPDSKGNPVLLDQRFRQALQWAVDRESVASVAFSGFMSTGGTLVVPYSEFHWEPPAEQAYTYDPEKAKAQLDAAGYKDVDGDGFRETAQGKPLALRLYVANEIAADVTASKLVAGWLKDVGVKVRLETLDPGAITAAVWNYEGDTFAPDYDIMLYYWTVTFDPQTVLGLLTPEQIGAWSDTSWTDPAYSALFAEQSTDIDQQSRIAKVQEMQQIVYEASPYVIFGYQQQLEAYDSAGWQGYVAAPSGFQGYNGAVLQTPAQIDTYLGLQPVASATSAGETSSNAWIYAVVAAAVVVAALVVWLWLRSRRREVEG